MQYISNNLYLFRTFKIFVTQTKLQTLPKNSKWIYSNYLTVQKFETHETFKFIEPFPSLNRVHTNMHKLIAIFKKYIFSN